VNVARVYTPEDRAIQTPNADTPYSFIGLDLRTEPMVLTVPPIEQERYFSLQFIDWYTHNFDYAGSRTTGNAGGVAGVLQRPEFRPAVLPHSAIRAGAHGALRADRGRAGRKIDVATLSPEMQQALAGGIADACRNWGGWRRQTSPAAG
jgi:hypothetical protein